MFTCAKQGQVQQSYARPGERCENDINGECADADCTKPRSNPGFWRLDLDLQFACSTAQAPCQTDLTGEVSTTGLLASLNPFEKGNDEDDALLSLDSICHAGTTIKDDEGHNQTTCSTDTASYRQCSVRKQNKPGTCLFRRPKEARRALGGKYWPWSCPGEDLGILHPEMGTLATAAGRTDQAAAKTQCQNANSAAYDYVATLKNATCPSRRVNHLVNYSIYDEFPSLVMSDVCFGIVACNPKESCLGNNECSEGYEYNKYRCLSYNKKNPDRMNCTSDDQCRTRSGVASEGNNGLTSACDPRHPEDCSRCVIENNADIGTCQCVGGGPRCSLCSQSMSKEDSHDDTEHKGFFRLNDECQECPENPVSFHEEPILLTPKLNILHSSFRILHYLLLFLCLFFFVLYTHRVLSRFALSRRLCCLE